MPPGPLAGHPPETVNYTVDGPKHRLLMHDFPRRIRAELANRMYLPPDDVRRDLLEPSGKHTVCPYKGTSTHWSLRAATG